ncbi:MAG TPA: hypothetical protein VG454_11270 [Gemmatimonadales bacterium]|nr:hypothetical protein [Gemmatimonadales bacterium]
MSLRASSEDRRGSLALWFAVFGAPVAWFAGLVASYFAVHEVCRVHSPLGPRLVSFAALAVAIAAGLTARAISANAKDRAADRTRFMGQVGMMAGAVFSLILVLQLVATLFLPGCHERPRTNASPDVFVPQVMDPSPPA